MNTNTFNINMDFSENIFNDPGNGDIEFDISDYNDDLDITLNELTILLLVQIIEDYIYNPVNKVTSETTDVHLNKKQRK